MRDETIGSFLTRLAARSAAPGGGATGALHAAQAAALLAMVARFSDGPRYDAETVGRVRAAADGLADEAVDLAVADEAAFGKVAAAYQLPRQTPEEKEARSAAIAEATGGAARPPADLMAAVGPAGRPGRGTAAGREQERDLRHRGGVGRDHRRRDHRPGQHRGEPPRDQGRSSCAAELKATAALADGVADRADRVVAAVREEISR